MIQTTYSINLSIDAEEFSITLCEPSAEQKARIESFAKEKTKEFDARLQDEEKLGEIALRIEELEQTLKINDALCKEEGILQKINLLIESKKIVKELSDLKRQKRQLSQSLPLEEVNAVFEEVMRLKFQMLVRGDEKERLASTLLQKGISFSKLWKEIESEVSVLHQKKSSD